MRAQNLFASALVASLPLAANGSQGTLADYKRADSISARLTPLFVGMPSAPE